MTNSKKRVEVFAVIDTQIFIPALAGRDPEARFYSAAIQKCWKFVFSEDITNEYARVMRKFGFPADVVGFEISKLYAMNKYRYCEPDVEQITDELAPRKDRHIVAPCRDGHANVIVSEDRGVCQRAQVIRERLAARVLSLDAAQRELDGSKPCDSAS